MATLMFPAQIQDIFLRRHATCVLGEALSHGQNLLDSGHVQEQERRPSERLGLHQAATAGSPWSGASVTRARDSSPILVVALQPRRAKQSHDGVVVGKDADDVGPTLDLLVDAFERIGGGDLGPMRPGDVHVGEHVLAGGVRPGRALRLLLAERVGDPVPPGQGR